MATPHSQFSIKDWPDARPVTELDNAELSNAVAFVFDRWSGALQAVVYAADDGHEMMSAGRSTFLMQNTDANNYSIIDALKHKLQDVTKDVILWWTCTKTQISHYEPLLQTVHPKIDLRYITDNYPNAKRFYLDELGITEEKEITAQPEKPEAEAAAKVSKAPQSRGGAAGA